MLVPLALLLAGALQGASGPGGSLARDIRAMQLDPEQCYRVREVTLVREDARIYFTDGYLAFARPVGGAVAAAVFTAEVEGGDAEILVMPPLRSERQSLASYTHSPNLNEHFAAAILLFSDDTHKQLMEQIRSGPFNKKSPEMGVLLDQRWSSVVRNLASSFETRLVLDLLSGRPPSEGVFVASLQGRKLGNFDVFYDPRSQEQLTIGQVAFRENRPYFDVWTSYETRSFRAGRRKIPPPEISIGNYRMEVTLEPDLQLKAVTRITVVPAQTLRVVPFDIAQRMKVTGAAINGQPAEVFEWESMRSNLIQGNNQLVLVIPPAPLEAGQPVEMELRHEGAVVLEAGQKVYSVISRGNWYPTRGPQYADFDITFRHSRELDLVSVGDVVEDRTEGEWRVTRRRTSVPVRLAGFNLGVYERTRIKSAGTTVEVCANRSLENALQPKPQPPVIMTQPQTWPRNRRPDLITAPAPPPPTYKPAARLPQLAEEVAAALEFMAARFGPPPLRTLTVSPVPGAWGQGFPGLIYLSTISYLAPGDRPIQHLNELQRLFFADILLAHETAHQWWGNLVSSPGYHDDWIMEGLANYSALLYLEQRRGPKALESVLNEYRFNLLKKDAGGKTLDSAGPIVMGSRLESSQTPGAWRIITYEKGSWILHMLRRKMGDRQFDAMLGELRRRFEFKTISTEQLRLLAAEFLPPQSPDPKLELFFEQWVYGTGIPTLELKYSLRGRAPALKLTGSVKQSDVEEDFSLLVPVEIQFARGKSIVQWVRTGSAAAPFTVGLKQAPSRVVLDPQTSLLAVIR